jgi:hypothetical protein
MTASRPENRDGLGGLRSRDRRRVLIAVVGLAAVVAVAGTALMLGPHLSSPQQQAAEAAPPPASLVTVQAERRVLTEPVVLRGTVVAGPSVKVLPSVSMVGPDAVVTAVKVKKGDRLDEGTQVLEVAGSPVVALDLPFPLYRDLIAGSTGPDVLAVQQALRRLGYAASKTGKLDARTQLALVKWWHNLGYKVPRRSTGETAPASGTEDAGSAPDKLATTSNVTNTGGSEGAYLPRSAIIRISGPGSVSAVRVKRGDILSDQNAPLLELNGGAPDILATVTKEQVGLLSTGQDASALDELSGKRAKLVVRSVADSVTTDDVTGTTGFAVRLRFEGAAISAVGRTLRIDVASAADDRPVLAVPVTAIYSRSDGTTYVTVAVDGRRSADVPVRTGQTGGGWTAVVPEEDGALTEGTAVVVGEG